MPPATRRIARTVLFFSLPLWLAALAASSQGREPAAAHRAHGPWVSAVFGGGGYVQNVVHAPSRPSRLFAYVDVGGAYRSDDAGATWTMLHGAFPAEEGYYSVRGLAPSPADADLVLMAIGNQWAPVRGLFRSADGGRTWNNVLAARVYGNEDYRWSGTVLSWVDARTVFFGSAGDGLHRSDDAGRTWRKVPGLDGVNIIDLDFASAGGRGWICAAPFTPHGATDALAGGFFRTDDGGRSWKRLAAQGPREVAVSSDGALLAVEDDRRLLRSRDGGDTWSDYSEGLPVRADKAGDFTSERRFQAIAAGPGFDLAASARGTVYRRAHGSPAWEKITPDAVRETVAGAPWWARLQPGKWPHFGAATASLVIDPAAPERWWLSDWYAAYESTDAGKNWTLKIDGIEVTVIHTVFAAPADPAIVHVGMADNAYARSLDGGLRFDTSKPASNMKMLAASPARPARLYAVGDGQAEWRASTVWVSEDRGETWNRSPMLGLPPRSKHSINSIVVHPRRPDEVYVAVSGPVKPGAGGVYASRDGGREFTYAGEGLPGDVAFFRADIWGVGPELAIDAEGALVAASHADGRVFRLEGETWGEVAAGNDGPVAERGKPQDLVCDGKTFWLARREGGLWRGEDGGRRWTRVLAGSVSAPAADATRPGRVACVADGKVRVSADSGATWREMPLPPLGLVSALAWAGEGLVAGTRGGGVFRASPALPASVAD